jgi:pre-mRNA-splicing factor SYF1
MIIIILINLTNTRHAMSIYDRATRVVADEDKTALYLLYITRAAELFGVIRTREVYEKAIENLPDKEVKNMCLRYAEMERRLGEIDRSRAIYIHGSQFSDPRSDLGFWKTWEDFEVQHGNEDTFRELLRIRRSVQAQYNLHVNVMSAEMLAHSATSDLDDQGKKRKATRVVGKYIKVFNHLTVL